MTNISLSNIHNTSVTNEPMTLTELTKSTLMKSDGDTCLGKRGRGGFRRNFSIDSFESDSSYTSPVTDQYYVRSSTPASVTSASSTAATAAQCRSQYPHRQSPSVASSVGSSVAGSLGGAGVGGMGGYVGGGGGSGVGGNGMMDYMFQATPHILPPPAPSNFRREPTLRTSFCSLSLSFSHNTNSGAGNGGGGLAKDAWGWFVDGE